MTDEISAKDVYQAINGLRGEVREDNKEMWTEIKDLRKRDDAVAQCAHNNKVTLEEHNGRLRNQKTEIENVKVSADEFDEHVGDQEIHFDKELMETTKVGYLTKKKFLAAVLGLLTLIITVITTIIMNRGM